MTNTFDAQPVADGGLVERVAQTIANATAEFYSEGSRKFITPQAEHFKIATAVLAATPLAQLQAEFAEAKKELKRRQVEITGLRMFHNTLAQVELDRTKAELAEAKKQIRQLKGISNVQPA